MLQMAHTAIERYCSIHGIDPEDFLDHLLPQTLHQPARLLFPMLRRVAPERFEVDRIYLACLGRVRSLKQMKLESSAYRHEHANRSFARRTLRMRVSVSRTHAILTPLLTEAEDAN